MKEPVVSVEIVPQLQDNYSYIVLENKTKDSIIVDPAESNSILQKIEKQHLKLQSILLTHHHNDHTAGVKNILKYHDVPVYSPSKNILGTTHLIKDDVTIKFNFINFKIIATPGHTKDHVIYYNEKYKLLFSGDTLFRLGCGRVFEGTYDIMYKSLKKIEALDNNTMVYCGHEYTKNNFKFLKSIFPEHQELEYINNNILKQITKTNSSIPFNLGEEKNVNPFLCTKSMFYENYKKNRNFSDFEMFSYLRKQKDNF